MTTAGRSIACMSCGAPTERLRWECNLCRERRAEGRRPRSKPRARQPASVLDGLAIMREIRTRDYFQVRPEVVQHIEHGRSKLAARLRNYELTYIEWLKLVAMSDSSCFICGFQDLPLQLHIDHDHESGRVRGLLCMRCNTGLGMLRIDGIDAVRRADSIRRYLVAKTPLVIGLGESRQRV